MGHPVEEQQRLDLDFTTDETYECGAAMVSLLVFPSRSEARARSNLQSTLCAEYLRNQFLTVERQNVPILIKPKYAFRAEADIRRDRKTFIRRVRDRMYAAHMAIAFLQAAKGQIPKLPKAVDRVSLNALSEYVADEMGQAEPGNVESRVWRPSVPVIHLAAAIAVAINDGERDGQVTSIGDLLHHRTLIENIVRETEDFENTIKNSKLPINPAKLVKIRIRLPE